MIIRWLFLVAFASVASIGLIWALRDRRRIFEFPSLVALCTLIYLMPQAVVAVMADERLVPTDACCLTLFHGTNCLFLAYMGYFQYKTPLQARKVRLDSSRLFMAGSFWTIIGVASYIALDMLVYGGFLQAYSLKSGRYTVEFTGIFVQLTFISRLVLPGMMIVFIATLARVTIPRIIMLLAGLMYPMLDVLVGGRRYMLAMVVGSFVFPLVYVRRMFPPRWMVITGVAIMGAATVIMPAVRYDIGLDKGFGAVFKLDLQHAFEEHYRADKVELPYHMLAVAAVMELNWYGYGVDFYNALIKQYIPRSLVGDSFKSQYFLPGTNPEQAMLEVYGTAGRTYLAEGGIVDSFFQFSFAGCILFFFAGRTFRHIWDRAMRDRDLRFIIAACLFGWVPPYIVYGGFLSTMNRVLPMLVVLFSATWFATIRESAPLPVRNRRPAPGGRGPGAGPGPNRGRPKGPRRPSWRPGVGPVSARA